VGETIHGGASYFWYGHRHDVDGRVCLPVVCKKQKWNGKSKKKGVKNHGHIYDGHRSRWNYRGNYQQNDQREKAGQGFGLRLQLRLRRMPTPPKKLGKEEKNKL
jgi:hypothetical protein